MRKFLDERQVFSALLAFVLGFALCGTVISLMNSGGTHSQWRDPGIQSGD